MIISDYIWTIEIDYLRVDSEEHLRLSGKFYPKIITDRRLLLAVFEKRKSYSDEWNKWSKKKELPETSNTNDHTEAIAGNGRHLSWRSKWQLDQEATSVKHARIRACFMLLKYTSTESFK